MGNNINTLSEVIELEGMDCIDMVQDRDKWWALVHMVMNCLVP